MRHMLLTTVVVSSVDSEVVDGIFVIYVVFSAIMRLSNELVYGGALQCANHDIAHARLHSSVSRNQVCRSHTSLTGTVRG